MAREFVNYIILTECFNKAYHDSLLFTDRLACIKGGCSPGRVKDHIRVHYSGHMKASVEDSQKELGSRALLPLYFILHMGCQMGQNGIARSSLLSRGLNCI